MMVVVTVTTAVLAAVSFVVVDGSCGYRSSGDAGPVVCVAGSDARIAAAILAPLVVLASMLVRQLTGLRWVFIAVSTLVGAVLLGAIASAW